MLDGGIPSPQHHPSIITIATTVNGSPISAMLDTGATTSFISQFELSRITHSTIRPVQTTAILGDGQTTIKINGAVDLCISINNITTVINALIVETLGAQLILGMDWCTSNNVTLCVGQQQVHISHPIFGSTTVPFIKNSSVDVRLAECVALLPHREYIVKMNVPFSSAELAVFTPDMKRTSQLNIEVPDAIVTIKDFSFYISLYNPTRCVHKMVAGTRIGSLQYQATQELVYSILDPSRYTTEQASVSQLNLMHIGEC